MRRFPANGQRVLRLSEDSWRGDDEAEMNRHTSDGGSVQESVPSPPLPADHVLNSGAVLFPGAFDQYGCPLILFPADGQDKLSSELSKAEVVDFINYFLCLHKKQQEKNTLVSVVADLRQASPHTTRFIAETLLLLEFHKRTVHTLYVIQPKKDTTKLLLKLLTPSAKSHTASFKKVLLKDVSELSNYIDRSQLTTSLGGYLFYCHRSWVTFIKEIDTFMQEFLSVVQRLPWCISTLQALSRLPLPSTFTELQHFCSINEAKFLQLRRELRLDELLRHCESVVEKLHCPEREPCYQAMAGTTLFTHTAFDMLQNHSRITAAVEKVEQLWQQAFSKARLQLRVFQLREEALQVTEQTEHLLQNKLQPYKIEIANDAAKAEKLMSDFEMSIHTPAMALVHRAEDVIHTVAEILPVTSPTRERWVHDLERLKEKLRSAVHFILQNLRAVSTYYHYYNKADSWYRLVLSENFLQELLSDVGDEGQKRNWATLPARKRKLSAFLKKNPPPYMEELVHLAHLSNVVPDDDVRQAGTQMAHRCTILRKLLISSSPVAVGHLQLALQWQYEFLRRGCSNPPSAITGEVQEPPIESCLPKCNTTKDTHLLGSFPPTAFSGMVSAEAKPSSLSSFDSGFDGAGSSQLEASGWKEEAEGLSGLSGSRDSIRPKLDQPQTHTANICTSGSEDHREEFDFVGNPPRTSVQVIPKVTVDSLNFEIKVTRSAALPNNPWLSLPVDDLENSYTVTITQNPTPIKREPPFPDPSAPYADTNSTRDQTTQMEALNKAQSRVSRSSNRRQHSQSSLEDPELSPICKILSSTITDGRDQSSCTTEGVPTLLWDSYDLHNLSQESVSSVIDISVKEQDELKDWDVKEQEGLNKVEKILVKTDEILEEEENVLAQEAILDVLVRSEKGHWPAWDSDNHLSVMSSSELAEAGVLGLEDPFDLGDSEDISGSATPTCTEAPSGADVSDYHSQTNLLTELRKVHILDELIREENLKIHELRRCEETPSDKPSVQKPAVTSQLLDKSKEREAFREHLEREKREVEILEKSLDMECNVKHQSRAKKVVKCSIMENVLTEAKEDQALCDKLLSGIRNKSPSSQSAPLLEEECPAPDTCTDSIQTELCPDKDQPHPAPRCEVDSVFSRNTLNSCSVAEEPADEARSLPPASVCNTDSDPSAGDENMCKPETSSMAETKPDDGSFDPGGESPPRCLSHPETTLFPVNEHDTGSLVNAALSSSSAPDPTLEQLNEQEHSPVSLPNSDTPAVKHSVVLSPNVKEHSNNNNNHILSETSYVSLEHSTAPNAIEGATSVTPIHEEFLLKEEEVQAFPLADERPHQSPPQLPPASGLDELGQDLFEELQSSQVMRTSSSRSPAFQVPLNVNEMTNFKTPIVLDTGSGLMKAGFADQDIPNVIFPTIIGQPKYEEIMNGNLEREAYIGHEAQHMRGVLALKRPIKNGIICNWDEMEKIWHHTFQQLCVDPEDHPVLLTEAAMNPLQNRQRTVEIMFECFCVPFTYVAMQAVLALYAAGRCTGVVFDSGDGLSHSVPVFEGYCLPHAVQRFPLAGVDVTMQLKTLLREQGVCMRTSAEVEIVREMKEKCCHVALNYDAEVTRGGSSCGEMHYTMPDGQIVTLSTERFRAPEILFKPELIGRDHYGMHESVFKSVLSSDIDLRRCFLGNIVLSGGNTLLSGLPERLQAEIRGLVPADMANGVCVTSPEDRDFSVWSGGAALANLHAFSSAWISQEEYEEFGPQIVFRKCF